MEKYNNLMRQRYDSLLHVLVFLLSLGQKSEVLDASCGY